MVSLCIGLFSVLLVYSISYEFMLVSSILFFFLKQKTASEISDGFGGSKMFKRDRFNIAAREPSFMYKPLPFWV